MAKADSYVHFEALLPLVQILQTLNKPRRRASKEVEDTDWVSARPEDS
jgi:hypothetical protein